MNTPGRSLFVRLTGPDSGPGAAGNWTDAATGEHGDLLDLIRLNRNLNGLGEAMSEARRFLALPRPPPPSPPNLDHTPPAAAASSEAARRLFAAGRPLPGTPAEAYLRARGITGRLGWPALRYHPSVYYRATEDAPLQIWPALLAAVTDIDGNITGIQRTWLDPRQSDKAPLADPRRALGHLLGNGVRFGKAADILVAGEGIETMLALKSVLPPLPVIAGLSANHLAALDLPPAPCPRIGSGAGSAPPLCRPRQRRRRSQGGAPVARTRHRRRHRNPRSRAGLWRLQPRSLPSRPRQHAGASRGSARPLRPDALSARCSPLRSAAVSAGVISVHRAGRGSGFSFACADVPWAGRKRSRAAAFPSGDLPAARPGCNGAGQLFSAAGLIIQRIRTRGRPRSARLCSANKIVARRHPPRCSGPKCPPHATCRVGAPGGATRLRRRPRDRREGRDRRG
jgi:hypothetical protein